MGDIIFYATDEIFVKIFSKLMQTEFEMSMMEELMQTAFEMSMMEELMQTEFEMSMILQHGQCKRIKDSNASHDIPWTRRGINKGGWDIVQNNDIMFSVCL